MGFESSRAARRRLAAVAATNRRVREALSPSAFPGFLTDFQTAPARSSASTSASHSATSSTTPNELHQQLDLLAHDIVATPGAGGALLAAYAAQARALTMVVEAARRAGGAPLPAAVVLAAEAALTTPNPLAGISASN